MENYIKDLSYVIQNGSMTNTYKMVWIRAIVETCVENPNLKLIHLDQLSEKIFGYYWDQAIFFDLKQGASIKQNPVIYQLVLKQINKYRKAYGNQPKFYYKVSSKVEVPLKEIGYELRKYVSDLFPKVGNKKYNIYDLDKPNRTVAPYRPDLLNQYSDILFPMISFRLTQKLEEFNDSPRIAKKVKGVEKREIRRQSLGKFKEYLDLENPDRICFFTGQKLDAKNTSIDHIIPWSYLFSDDLWNLVYVNRGFNSSKSNKIPDQQTIDKLKKRNERLYNLLKTRGAKQKETNELKIAIENDLVGKFWVGCR